MEIKVRVTDNLKEALKALESQSYKALLRCGLEAEKHAKDLAPVDTGELKKSISHAVRDDTMYVGTNIEYGAYVELGTGKWYEGGGRLTPWMSKTPGEGMTTGQEPQPYLKPAIADYQGQYKAIIEDELKG